MKATLSLLLVLGLLFLSAWERGESDSESFLADERAVEEAILDGDVAEAWVASSSALYRWVGHEDFVDLAETIEDTYGFRAQAEVADEYAYRCAELDGGWVAWVHSALMASALRHPEEAFDCMVGAASCESYPDTSSMRLLRGRFLLDSGLVEAATMEYEWAVAVAEESGNPGQLFRARQSYADDLYDRGHPTLAVERGYVCKESEYPVERAWGLAQEIVYLWSRGEEEKAAESVAALSAHLPSATWSAESDWERRRYGQAEGILQIARGALSASPVQRMILDVECTDFHYAMGEFDLALKRLRPWAERYPIRDYEKLEGLAKEWSLWANYNYNACLSLTGDVPAAEAGFRETIDNVSFEEAPLHVTIAWCSLGRALYAQGEYEKSVEAFLTGLDLDATDARTMLPTSITDHLDQVKIRGGKVPDFLRASYIREYKYSLAEVNRVEGGTE
jgi:tetratricopeptide (TPR) repeat protein